MNRFAASFAAAIFCLTASTSAFALTSVCGKSDSVRMASHTVNLNWYESTIVNSLEWESALVGTKNVTLSNKVKNASIIALDLFYTLPYGSYTLTGTAKLNAVELGKWEQLSGSKCYIVFDFPEPEECPGDPEYSNRSSLTLEIQNDIKKSIDWGGFECSSDGTITVTGNMERFDIRQECCDITRFGSFGSGSVSIGLSGVSCSVESPTINIVQIATRIKLQFAISASGNGGISADAPTNICVGSNRQGTVSANFDGTVSMSGTGVVSVAPPVNVIKGTVTGSGSAGFSLAISATDLTNVSASGCFGPVKVTGSYSVGILGYGNVYEGTFNDWSIPNSKKCT